MSSILNIEERRGKLNNISETIIGCAYHVSRTLGCGFLEKVYENALMYELKQAGLKAAQQVPVNVHYDIIVVGVYVADILVEDSILVELKAIHEVDNVHRAQCLNYLNATGLRLCLLINFGKPRAEIQRIVRDF